MDLVFVLNLSDGDDNDTGTTSKHANGISCESSSEVAMDSRLERSIGNGSDDLGHGDVSLDDPDFTGKTLEEIRRSSSMLLEKLHERFSCDTGKDNSVVQGHGHEFEDWMSANDQRKTGSDSHPSSACLMIQTFIAPASEM